MRIALLAAAAALPLATAAPAAAAEVQLNATGPVVELNVTEEVSSVPDLATIGTGVTTRAPTAKVALTENSRKMTAVVDRLKSLGIAARDIQTSGINLNAQYSYGQNQPPRFTGYEASNRVSAKVRDLKRLGDILDALVAAGATNLDGPNFTLENNEGARAQARTQAFAKAKAQAQDYARMAGYTGVRLLSISESVGPGRPVPMMARMEAAPRSVSAPPPVEAGEVSASVTISVQYELTR